MKLNTMQMKNVLVVASIALVTLGVAGCKRADNSGASGDNSASSSSTGAMSAPAASSGPADASASAPAAASGASQ
ncbi:hypothetical protein [Paraburkholderia sp.]|uniref:hypothetical protein n=1 Tax=Paraburkholderia sp. TaxID=1926495 RepID=UPI003D6DD0EF